MLPNLSLRKLKYFDSFTSGTSSIAELECWAFSPPGGMVSPNLSAVTAPYCTSVAVNKASHVVGQQMDTLYICEWSNLDMHL